MKIEAHKRFIGVFIPLMAVTISAGFILISLAIFWLQPNAKQTLAKPVSAQSMLPTAAKSAQIPTVQPKIIKASPTRIVREIKILQALGEDPSNEIIDSMNADQLAKELNDLDKIEINSYEQPALPTASSNI